MRRTHARGSLAAAAFAAVALAALPASPAGGETVGRAGVVAGFDASFQPHRLPRDRSAPISLTLSGSIHGTEGTTPPRLRSVEIAFGARGGLDAEGLPRCP